jgi:flagellar biosynthesis protein FliR
VIVAQFGLMFSLGTVLVAPVVAVLLLLDAGLAMAAKTMPQMNVFMISIPVKIVVGLLMLAALAPFLSGILRRIFESIFTYWQALAR